MAVHQLIAKKKEGSLPSSQRSPCLPAQEIHYSREGEETWKKKGAKEKSLMCMMSKMRIGAESGEGDTGNKSLGNENK